MNTTLAADTGYYSSTPSSSYYFATNQETSLCYTQNHHYLEPSVITYLDQDHPSSSLHQHHRSYSVIQVPSFSSPKCDQSVFASTPMSNVQRQQQQQQQWYQHHHHNDHHSSIPESHSAGQFPSTSLAENRNYNDVHHYIAENQQATNNDLTPQQTKPVNGARSRSSKKQKSNNNNGSNELQFEFYDPQKEIKSYRPKTAEEKEELLFKNLKEYEQIIPLEEDALCHSAIYCKVCGNFYNQQSANNIDLSTQDYKECCGHARMIMMKEALPGYMFYNEYSGKSMNNIDGLPERDYPQFTCYDEERYLLPQSLREETLELLSSLEEKYKGEGSFVRSNRLVCPHEDCSDVYFTQIELEAHIEHTPCIKCPGCSKSYEKPFGYMRHLSSQHSTETRDSQFAEPLYEYIHNVLMRKNKNGFPDHQMLPNNLREYYEIFENIGVNFVSWLMNRSESSEMLKGYDWGFFLEFGECMEGRDWAPFSKSFIPILDPRVPPIRSNRRRFVDAGSFTRRKSERFMKPEKTIYKRDSTVLRELHRYEFRVSNRDSMRKTISSGTMYSRPQ